MNLGIDLGRGAEGCVIEHGQILIDCTACGFRRKPLIAFDPLLPVRVRLDQAGIDRKVFARRPSPSSMQRRKTVSNKRRSRSLSRKRPCRFFEKVEWSGTSPSSPSRQNQR